MKRKRLPSRKRRALRRLAWALAALMLANHLGIGYLLPSQAIGAEEERQGTGRTWTVEHRWVPELYRTHRFYLRENEDAVLLGDTYFSLLGWEPLFGCALDCTQEAPVYAALHHIGRDGKVLECYFGRIDDPAIETVGISIQEVTYNQGREVRTELRRLTAGREDLLARDGRTFFWLIEAAPELETERATRPVLIAYDGDGTVVTEFEIEQQHFSTYG